MQTAFKSITPTHVFVTQDTRTSVTHVRVSGEYVMFVGRGYQVMPRYISLNGHSHAKFAVFRSKLGKNLKYYFSLHVQHS